MSFLESAKQYTGSDLETIFFRPILSGDSARELGVRVLYNMPVPTTIQLWDGQRNVLQKYSAAGWTGGNAATKLQKTISLGRVKAELGFRPPTTSRWSMKRSPHAPTSTWTT